MIEFKKVIEAQTSYIKKLVSTPVTIPSAPKQAPIASWGVPYNWLTAEEKTRAWFTDGSAHRAGTT